jgi:PTH1 family peptidyl-tRNA hydrolase
MFSKFRSAKTSGKIKYIIAGLGNPGKQYLFTRHNAGFLALDYISQKYKFKINNSKFKSLCAKYTCAFEKDGEENKSGVLFIKPQTYMNGSGLAVYEAARYYGVPAENILIISDDASLPVGKLRIRKGGSDGGQKGLKSIFEIMSSNAFPRIKIGVGEKPSPDYDLAEWVLSRFVKEEREIIFKTLEKVYECVELFLKETPVEDIQNKYN